ncbi:MAG TPA: CHRD domain-containing protein [Candidatus Binatia bacterium]|nr:CHRD domain-containing protein [Candidatus Binatia bacterium]
MRRAARTLCLAISTSILLAGTTLAAPAIPLNNGQETTDAKFGGSGFFSYTIDGTEFCYDLSWRNLTDAPFAAHVHGVAGRREATGIVIPLAVVASATGSTSGCVTIDAGLAAAIEANPGGYYVNVHTTLFPGGEVRGQLK